MTHHDESHDKEPQLAQTIPIIRPLKDYLYLSMTSQTSCIQLTTTNAYTYEMKPEVISMLPKFRGSTLEDPYLFIRDFEEVCRTLRTNQIPKDSLRLRLIPFALRDKAKKWLNSLPLASISNWEELLSVFLKKIFPHHKTT